MNELENEITVSVLCLTYNHEKFIAQAIEGFLMQKTNFRIEILIGDDCSTDNNRMIIESYSKKYPELIKILSGKTNIGAIRNQANLISNAKGKYIAFCDGDDYWTNPNKLQKQIDFLDNNPEYIICSHYSKVIDDSGNTLYVADKLVPFEYKYDDLLLGKREETRIGTSVFRNVGDFKQITRKLWYYDTFGTDSFLKLYITLKTGGKIYVIPEVMSCYRMHQDGVWSMIDPKIRKRRMISDFNLLINNFNYSSIQKKDLLKIYFKKYFLFELRDLKIKSAYNTIAHLL